MHPRRAADFSQIQEKARALGANDNINAGEAAARHAAQSQL